MITSEQLNDVMGATAYDGSGDKIGKVGNVYYDDETDQPKWLTVHTGLFGGNETFVPMQGADLAGAGRVTVAYDKATVKDAPNVDENGHLSPDEEQQLYRYYQLGDTTTGRDASGPDYVRTDHGDGDSSAGTTTVDPAGPNYARTDYGTAATGERAGGREFDADFDGRSPRGENREGVFDGRDQAAVGHDTSGPTTDGAMTRSEEQLRVGTRTQETGRARLRKRVVTETEQATVPVSHEEVTVEREPITDANRGDAYDGPAISEEEHEVVLHAERPVVGTEAVAVERIRMGTNTVQNEETVSGDVRKEVVDVHHDGDTGRGARDDGRDDRR